MHRKMELLMDWLDGGTNTQELRPNLCHVSKCHGRRDYQAGVALDAAKVLEGKR